MVRDSVSVTVVEVVGYGIFLDGETTTPSQNRVPLVLRRDGHRTPTVESEGDMGVPTLVEGVGRTRSDPRVESRDLPLYRGG